VVKKILKRFKLKNKIYFEVLWGDDSQTNEPRSSLIKDIPLLIEEFEKSDKKVPSTSSENKYIIKKLLKRFKLKNKVYFEVLWGDNSKTNEPRSNLIKDIPLLIEEFEKSKQFK
jgi:hypothetical protein